MEDEFTKTEGSIATQQIRPYPWYLISPFLSAPFINKSELACDNPVEILAAGTLNVPGVAILTYSANAAFKIMISREPMRLLANPNFWKAACVNSLLQTYFICGSIPFYLMLALPSSLLQLKEERVMMQKREKEGDGLEDVKAAFGPDAYGAFISGSEFDGSVVRGFTCGLLIAFLNRKRMPASIQGLYKDSKFERADACAVGGIIGGFLGGWFHQPLTGGFAARNRLGEHRAKAREVEKLDLERVREIEAARTLRLAEIKKMRWYDRQALAWKLRKVAWDRAKVRSRDVSG